MSERPRNLEPVYLLDYVQKPKWELNLASSETARNTKNHVTDTTSIYLIKLITHLEGRNEVVPPHLIEVAILTR